MNLPHQAGVSLPQLTVLHPLMLACQKHRGSFLALASTFVPPSSPCLFFSPLILCSWEWACHQP